MDVYVIVALLTWTVFIAEAVEYCPWEEFKARCPAHQVITIETAKYGRLSKSRCIERDYGYVGCSGDVRQVAEKACSGRRECAVVVPNEEMDKILKSVCPRDLSGYLNITYTCKPVVKPETPSNCDLHPEISSSHAFIASSSTSLTGCGQNDRPWKIVAAKGQRINFTLHDYTSGQTDRTRTSGHSRKPCKVYAVIKDVDGETSRPVCGGFGDRVTHAYKSKGSTVEVRVTNGAATDRYFLLEYEVLGCPDLTEPPGGWVKYTGNDAEIGCHGSDDTWQLKCQGRDWKGRFGLCAGVEPVRGKSTNIGGGSFGNVNTPLSVIIVVCVAILLGLLILAAGILCLRRRRNHPYASAASCHPPGLQGDRMKDYPPDYHSNAPPSYYEARTMTPDHEYEYVSDVLQRKEQLGHMHRPTAAHSSSGANTEILGYTGTGYGTLPPVVPPIVPSSTGGGTSQVTFKPNAVGQMSGNVYVPDNVSVTSTKYFELDRGQRDRVARQHQPHHLHHSGDSPSVSGNAYNSLHQCAQASKQQFGHYSQ